ncbi:MAG: hypothetical protein QOH72_2312 [Solirubrobacteraceae bacterium]|jgi:hypothetical protein|nr:hypothetical protein [Solirubrobacteraceae bacterium]
MFDRTRLSRIITLALASCAVTWAFAAGAFARPDVGTVTAAGPAPAYKTVAGDVNKAPSTTSAPAFKGIVADSNKTPDRAVVDRNIASLGHGGKAGPANVVNAGNDDTGTIALITAIAAMLVALAAVTLIIIRPQPPVLRT